MSQSPIRDKVKRVMAATFRVPAERIADGASPETVNGWDSLGHIELMLALEMEFGVALPTEKIIDLVSVDAIEDFLRNHAGAVAK